MTAGLPAGYGTDALLLGEGDLAFATDLYQLTMAAAYWARGELPRATFELYVRRLPRSRNFLVFAGLEQALACLPHLRFDRAQIDYLSAQPTFDGVDPGFFDMLAGLRFGGEVWAMEEGRVFFPQEPVLRVTGSLLEAQIVETLLLSIVNFQTLIASKAARMRIAAGADVSLAEFGTRRAHGPAAGAWGARAAYIGGFDSTSNVLAGQRLGVPIVGTMAHSFVLSFDDEAAAFAHYASVFPEYTVHLVDTYDTLEGVRRAIGSDRPFAGIRLDSGDIETLARDSRRLLDDAGRTDAKIFVSGDMHELKIRDLLVARAPIDAFGVGTRLVSSTDSPTLGGVYKLVEIEKDDAWIPKRKRSAGKLSFAGSKQVLRFSNDGTMTGDRLVSAREGDCEADAEPLLRLVYQGGKPIRGDTLCAARARCLAELEALPEELRSLESSVEYPVEIDSRLAVEN